MPSLVRTSARHNAAISRTPNRKSSTNPGLLVTRLQESAASLSQLCYTYFLYFNSIFFDNTEANAKYFELEYKPTKSFKIVFECMINNSKKEKITYNVIIH